MSLIADIALYVFSFAFLSGLVLTSITGSARAVKIYLAILAVISLIGLSIGIVASSGLLIFLLFQIISLLLIISFVIVSGAVVGGGIYKLIHNNSGSKNLLADDIGNYIPLTRFSEIEGISQERALSRIKSGFYTGGSYQDDWYVHKDELSQHDD